jgi:hypothetical protein
MSRRADELAAEYLMRPLEDPPRFLNSPPIQDGPEHTTPLQTIAGFALLALVAFIFGVLL